MFSKFGASEYWSKKALPSKFFVAYSVSHLSSVSKFIICLEIISSCSARHGVATQPAHLIAVQERQKVDEVLAQLRALQQEQRHTAEHDQELLQGGGGGGGEMNPRLSQSVRARLEHKLLLQAAITLVDEYRGVLWR